MTPGIKELNSRFAAIGLSVALTPENAESLKAQAPRERVLNALSRVESANDSGARVYLEKTLTGAGLLLTEPTTTASYPINDEPSAQNAANRQPPMQPEPRSIHPANQGHSNAPSAADHPNAHGQNPSAASTNQPRRHRPSHHIYGKKAAVMFELDETKAGMATVALDGAQAVGERQYDWKNKVRLQMTASEVSVVAAVLFGILNTCNFANHGPNSDKGFAIEWQGERQSFFIKVWQGKGNLRAVPMTREDAFHAGQIVLRAIQQASPARLDAMGALASLRALYGRR